REGRTGRLAARAGGAAGNPPPRRHQDERGDARLGQLEEVRRARGGDRLRGRRRDDGLACRDGAGGRYFHPEALRVVRRIGTTLFLRPSAASDDRPSTSVPAMSTAPIATCAVVNPTERCERTVAAPSAICVAATAHSHAAALRSPSRRERKARTAQTATSTATASPTTRGAKWMATGKVVGGGTSLPSASGKSGMARLALVWRMTAPITSCRKIAAAVARVIRATGFREKAARRSAGVVSAQRGEVTTAIATVRQKKICARQAWQTEIQV